MTSDQPKPRSEEDAQLEREIRAQRKFSLSEAIGRLAGPGMMKGVSPATLRQQADAVLEDCLLQCLADSAGGLRRVLLRRVKESDLLLARLEEPLAVLAEYVAGVLDSDYRLQELVREADVQWGLSLDERPHFEQEGRPAHPDDPYTQASVRETLLQLIENLKAGDA